MYASEPWLERYADHVSKELPLPTRSMANLSEESVERAPECPRTQRHLLLRREDLIHGAERPHLQLCIAVGVLERGEG